MIKTKSIKLTPKSYFKVLISNYFLLRWWLYLFIWLVTVFLIFVKFDYFTVFMIVFSIIYPLMLVFTYWRYANSKDNKIAFIERYYEIDEEKMTAYLEDGTINPFKFSYIIKIRKRKEYWLLYISKSQFIYLPLSSFASENDFDRFKTYFSSLIKK
jgi:hypothetical protein